MTQPVLDQVLNVVENPIRRKIIRRLAHEPSYPLEISSDLGVNQQLVTKHLKVMEAAEIVEATRASSPYGPDRRIYELAKSVSLTIEFSPDLYAEQITTFQNIQYPRKNEQLEEFEQRFDTLLSKRSYRSELNDYAKLIADIDRRLNELDKEKAALLQLRCSVIRVAKEIIQGTPLSLKERIVAYHILNSNIWAAKVLSERLNLREETVQQILQRLKEINLIKM
ncbi:MAG: helix-turn-helix domain-containing protein [Nitrososphaerales archaeon]